MIVKDWCSFCGECAGVCPRNLIQVREYSLVFNDDGKLFIAPNFILFTPTPLGALVSGITINVALSLFLFNTTAKCLPSNSQSRTGSKITL